MKTGQSGREGKRWNPEHREVLRVSSILSLDNRSEHNLNGVSE